MSRDCILLHLLTGCRVCHGSGDFGPGKVLRIPQAYPKLAGQTQNVVRSAGRVNIDAHAGLVYPEDCLQRTLRGVVLFTDQRH